MKYNLLLPILLAPFSTIIHASQKYFLPTNESGYTSVHKAALQNDPYTIEAIAKQYPNEINRPSEYSKEQKSRFCDTPAHLASYHGCWNALSMLISYGAQLDIQNSNRHTPYSNVLHKEIKNFQAAIIAGRELLKSRKTNTSSTETQTTPIALTVQTRQTQTNPIVFPPEYKLPPAAYQPLPPAYHQSNNEQHAITKPLNPEARPFNLSPTNWVVEERRVTVDWTPSPKNLFAVEVISKQL